MLHARGQSTADLQQQHVDRLHRHKIYTTSAGMAHANGPTANATVNSTSWWWGQEQRVGLNSGDADTTQKATGATSAQQIDFVCNSSTAAVASLSLTLSLSVSLFKGTSQRYRHLSTCPFIFSQLQRSVCTNGIYSLLPQHRSLSLSLCLCSGVPHTTISQFLYLPFYCFAPTPKCLYKRHLLPTSLLASLIFRFVTTGLILCTPLYATN